MSEEAKKRLKLASLVRDGIAVGGFLSITAGAGIQFGPGYGLIVGGTICLAFIVLGAIQGSARK